MAVISFFHRAAHVASALLLLALSIAVLALASSSWHGLVDKRHTPTAILRSSDGSETQIDKLPKELDQNDAKIVVLAGSLALVASVGAIVLTLFYTPSQRAYFYASRVASTLSSISCGIALAAFLCASVATNDSPSFNLDDFSHDSRPSSGTYSVEAVTCKLREQNLVSGSAKSEMNTWCREMMAARRITIPLLIISFGLCISSISLARRLNPKLAQSSLYRRTELSEIEAYEDAGSSTGLLEERQV